MKNIKWELEKLVKLLEELNIKLECKDLKQADIIDCIKTIRHIQVSA